MQRTSGESSSSNNNNNNNSNIVLEFFNTKRDDLLETNLFVDVPFAEIIESTIGFDYFLERVDSVDIIETPLTHSPFSNTLQTSTTTTDTDDTKNKLKVIPQLFGKSTQKVCFLVSGYLWDCEHKINEVLECYAKNSTLSFCRIYISLSELAHLSAPGVTPSSFSHQSPFSYYCSQFKNRIEDDNVDFEIEFFPVVIHPVFSSPSLSAFILPSVCDYFPLSQTISVSLTQGSEVKLTDLPSSQQSSTHHMIHTTHSLLSLFGIDSPDLYPIGETSKIIAKEIYQLKSSTNIILSNSKIAPFQFLTGTSFIVIDRDLDLVAPCLHSDNAMDRIYSLVPTTRLGSAQLKVNMTPLYNENVSEGTLSHLFDPQAAPILQSMVTKSLKEVLTTVRKKLVELITSLNLPLDLTTRSSTITPLALITLLRILQKGKVSSPDEGSSKGLSYHHDPPLKYVGLIQCVVALIQSMQCAQHAMWEQFLSTEKILISIASENQSLIEHITEIMSQPIKGDPLKSRYSVKDMVTMCIVAYSLIGEKGFPWKDENILKEEIMKNIVEFKQSSPVDWLGENLPTFLPLDKNTSSLEQEQTQMELRDRIGETIDRLQKIGGTRKKLEDFSSLLKSGPGGTSSYLSLIGQIVKSALEEKEIKDFQKYVAPGSIMGSLLKSAGGWGLKSWGLGSNIRPKGKPLDNPNLMIYVVGGITFSEIKEVNEIVENYNKLNAEQNVNVILVGTGISTCNTVYNSVLCTERNKT